MVSVTVDEFIRSVQILSTSNEDEVVKHETNIIQTFIEDKESLVDSIRLLKDYDDQNIRFYSSKCIITIMDSDLPYFNNTMFKNILEICIENVNNKYLVDRSDISIMLRIISRIFLLNFEFIYVVQCLKPHIVVPFFFELICEFNNCFFDIYNLRNNVNEYKKNLRDKFLEVLGNYDITKHWFLLFEKVIIHYFEDFDFILLFLNRFGAIISDKSNGNYIYMCVDRILSLDTDIPHEILLGLFNSVFHLCKEPNEISNGYANLLFSCIFDNSLYFFEYNFECGIVYIRIYADVFLEYSEQEHFYKGLKSFCYLISHLIKQGKDIVSFMMEFFNSLVVLVSTSGIHSEDMRHVLSTLQDPLQTRSMFLKYYMDNISNLTNGLIFAASCFKDWSMDDFQTCNAIISSIFKQPDILSMALCFFKSIQSVILDKITDISPFINLATSFMNTYPDMATDFLFSIIKYRTDLCKHYLVALSEFFIPLINQMSSKNRYKVVACLLILSSSCSEEARDIVETIGSILIGSLTNALESKSEAETLNSLEFIKNVFTNLYIANERTDFITSYYDHLTSSLLYVMMNFEATNSINIHEQVSHVLYNIVKGSLNKSNINDIISFCVLCIRNVPCRYYFETLRSIQMESLPDEIIQILVSLDHEVDSSIIVSGIEYISDLIRLPNFFNIFDLNYLFGFLTSSHVPTVEAALNLIFKLLNNENKPKDLENIIIRNILCLFHDFNQETKKEVFNKLKNLKLTKDLMELIVVSLNPKDTELSVRVKQEFNKEKPDNQKILNMIRQQVI